MLYLPPHTTHDLQTSTELSSSPSRKALIKRKQNSGTTILTLKSGNFVSYNVSSLLGNKGTNGWEPRQNFGVHCRVHFNTSTIPEDTFSPFFIQDSVDSLSAGTHKIPFGSHNSLATLDFHSTSVLNKTGPRTDIQTQAKAVKTIFQNIIIPTTEKKIVPLHSKCCILYIFFNKYKYRVF